MLGRPGPWHELVETRGGPQVDQFCEHVGEVCLRIDAVQFTGFNERSDTGPIFGPVIVASEECIFSIQNNRADASLDNVGVELDAAVIEESSEPVPVVQGIADVFGDRRFAGDTCDTESG